MEDTIRYIAKFQEGKDEGYVERMDVEGYQYPFAPNQTRVITVGKALTATAPIVVDSTEVIARN